MNAKRKLSACRKFISTLQTFMPQIFASSFPLSDFRVWQFRYPLAAAVAKFKIITAEPCNKIGWKWGLSNISKYTRKANNESQWFFSQSYLPSTVIAIVFLDSIIKCSEKFECFTSAATELPFSTLRQDTTPPKWMAGPLEVLTVPFSHTHF